MAKQTAVTKPADVSMTQFATRIPKDLHRSLKLYCVGQGVSVMEFLITALQTALDTATKGKRKAS